MAGFRAAREGNKKEQKKAFGKDFVESQSSSWNLDSSDELDEQTSQSLIREEIDVPNNNYDRLGEMSETRRDLNPKPK